MSEIGSFSDKGRREVNEDSVLSARIDPPSHLKVVIAVADGMGGLNKGDVASQLVLKTIQDEIYECRNSLPVPDGFNDEEFEDLLEKLILQANKTLFEQEQGLAGSTITLTLIFENRLFVGHAGDSQAFLVSPESVQRLGLEDSVNKALTNRLGKKSVRVHVDSFSLDADQLILLTTDGITDVLDLNSILMILEDSDSVESACCDVVAAAIRKGSADNCSVVIYSNSEFAEIKKMITKTIEVKENSRRPGVLFLLILMILVMIAIGLIWQLIDSK